MDRVTGEAGADGDILRSYYSKFEHSASGSRRYLTSAARRFAPSARRRSSSRAVVDANLVEMKREADGVDEAHFALGRVVVEKALAATLYASVAAAAVTVLGAPLVAIIPLILWLLAVVRLTRLRVAAGTGGLFVRNPWYTQHVPWVEVTNIKLLPTESKNSFLVPALRQRGRARRVRLWAMAVPIDRRIGRRIETDRSAGLMQVLERWQHTYGVRVVPN
jgi:hypothetical protein